MLSHALAKSLVAVFLATALPTPHAASAQEAPAVLARQRACMSCHMVDRTLLGPAFQDVAVKYGDSKESRDRIFKSIREGSRGKWGTVPMPTNSRVTEQEARALANWIASMKKR